MTNNENITKEDIISYIDNIQLKKAGFGGVDKVDAFAKIYDVVERFDKLLKAELRRQKEQLEQRQKTEGESLHALREQLQKFQEQERTFDERYGTLEQEKKRLASSCQKVLAEKKELEQSLHSLQQQQSMLANENRLLQQENHMVKNQPVPVQESEPAKVEKQIVYVEKPHHEKRNYAGLLDSPDYYHGALSDILEEARIEGDLIIGNAHKQAQQLLENAQAEVEKGTLKALEIRAKYLAEHERYRKWQQEMEREKAQVDEFLAALSAEYKVASRVITAAKTVSEGFDMKRIFNQVQSYEHQEADDRIFEK